MIGRFAALTFALAASALPAAPTAMAQTVQPQGGAAVEDRSGLGDLVLPYAPYFFDIAVTSMRSLAEITYNDRRYDPITRSLVVTGLDVDRDAVRFRVGQMRIAVDQVILDDVSVDTSKLPLDPTSRSVLEALGREVVTGSVTLGLDLDAPRANYLVQATARLDGIGAFDLDGDLRGFHFLAPLDRIDGSAAPARGDRPEIRGRLASADVTFTDMGLVAALYGVLGRQQGLNPQAAKGAATMIVGAAIAGMFADLSGGTTPALQQRAQAFSAAVQAFLREPDRLRVSVRPAEPFDLARLTDGTIDARDVEDLAPGVDTGQTVTQPLRAPQQLQLGADAPLGEVLALADTLLAGRGTPQNAGRALELIMPAAMDGNRTAVALLAQAIAMDPYVAIAQEKLVPTYVSLDLALAEGLPFAAESLDAIGRRLSPAEIVGAEDEAVATWRQTPVGQGQRASEIDAFRTRDWATIRRLAYAYYEGAEMPRNIMRAYGWASIAAAGGDRAAARLRDELTRAAGSGKLVLPLDRARKATDDLWALILGGEPASAETAPAPEETNAPVESGAAGLAPGGDDGGAGSAGAGMSTDPSGSARGANDGSAPTGLSPADGATPAPGETEGPGRTPAPQPPRAGGTTSGEAADPKMRPDAAGGDAERATAQGEGADRPAA